MKRYNTPLPTLGLFAIDFHKESAEILKIINERELERLRDVPHLGVAASVFTGVNHSRLEYTMLQCAVISLVAKLNKNQEELALSGPVELDGLKQKISSGEELLKTWSILSNYGHTQWTYGVERSLLQLAHSDAEFKTWITRNSTLRGSQFKGLNRWTSDVIEQYEDGNIHFLIALKRLSMLPEWERKRRYYSQFIRNLVLPVESLHKSNSKAQYKLQRLRTLFNRIRLLCIIALDSHYSHQPISLNLNNAILGFSDLLVRSDAKDNFQSTITKMAAWLADELYLHPNSVAVQRTYELKAKVKLSTQFKTAISTNGTLSFLKNIVNQGAGKPEVGRYLPLIRLSFDTNIQAAFGESNLYKLLLKLEKEIVKFPSTQVSVDKNRHSNTLHIDLLYESKKAGIREIVFSLCQLHKWIIRIVEADARRLLKNIIPVEMRRKQPQINEIFKRLIERRIDNSNRIFLSIFDCVLRLLLPIDYRFTISGFMPLNSRKQPFLMKIKVGDLIINNITNSLEDEINKNPRSHSKERLAELKALHKFTQNSSSTLQIICPESIKIFDPHGKVVDEWDGTVLEANESGISLTIIEAKSGGSIASREEDAFKQLESTRDLLRQRFNIQFRRTRISKIGAYIKFILPL